MYVFKIVQHFVAAVLIVVTTTGADSTAPKYLPVISGYAFFEAGEIMEGYSSVPNIPHHELFRTWLQTGYVGLRIDAAVKDYFKVIVGGEAQTFISFLRTEGNMNDAFTESRQPRTIVAIKHGEGVLSLGSAGRMQLEVEAGFFPFKYNREVRNLGEYLFRTYAYPPSMINEFDKPYADLTGLRIGGAMVAGPGKARVDLLLTTSMKFWPFMNWSPSILADYSLSPLFTAGGGIQWWNLIPVGVNNPKVVSISDWSNESPTEPDSNSTFAGTKLMARLTFDCKGLFPRQGFFVSILGENDLKIYGEAAVLGLKNYDGPDTSTADGYEKRSWRSPFMFGLNLPGFKAIDLLALEFEYLDSPYPNSIAGPIDLLKPIPSDKTSHARWKWSIYAAKDLGPHVKLIFQAARDHIMPQSTIQAIGYSDNTDVLLRPGDWWWTGKVRFSF